jgi:hypothetical protein
MQNPANTIPDVDMNKIKATIQDSIQQLLNQRKWIIQDFNERLKLLDAERDAALKLNEGYLKELGVSEGDIPAPPALNLNLGSIRKLSNNQIMSLLKEFMEPAVKYSSSEILAHLMISYVDFRKFVEENPSFLLGEGKNKGRYYMLVSNKI